VATKKTHKRFTYYGPTSGMTLRLPEGDREVMLFNRRVYDLPAAHPLVDRLVHKGHLVEHSQRGAQAPASTTEAS